MALPNLLNKFAGVIPAGLGVFGLGYLGYNSIFQVDGGHRAVVFNRFDGVKNQIYDEGLHFVFPWVEWPIIFDIRTRPRELPDSLAGTRDLQYVRISLRILYKPRITKLPNIVRDFGEDYDRKILPSIMNEVLKAGVALYNAEQLVTQREEVSRLVKRNMIDRSHDFYIDIEDCAITNVRFGPEFTAAVESKQVAQQEAEKAKYEVDMAKETKKQLVIHAQGEAEAATMIGAALSQNPAYAELKRIETAQQIAEALSHSRNRVFLDTDSLLVNLMRPIGGQIGSTEL